MDWVYVGETDDAVVVALKGCLTKAAMLFRPCMSVYDISTRTS